MRITAVSGWALPCEWFAAQVAGRFENARVRVIYPEHPFDREEARKLLESTPADLYLGYSLGGLWLMFYRDLIPASAFKAVLAPILAFTREQDRGGKTRVTQLKYLINILIRRPENNLPLMDFYESCEYPYPQSFLKDLPARSVLVEGLKFLQAVSVPPGAAQGFRLVVGDRDIFLDADKLQQHLPQVSIVEGAGHSPDRLLERLANTLIPEVHKRHHS